MVIQPNSKLLFIGDSISDYGRARPLGEGRGDSIGHSYIALVDALLKTADPASRVRVINMGISGDTTRDLLARWQTDVLDLQPDWLAIQIGTNDVWRHFDVPLQTECHVSLAEYEKNLTSLIETTLPTLKGLLLLTPFMMEPNRQEPMRAKMDEYGAVVKKLAQKYGAVLVDTQAEFDRYLRFYHPASINWDRIHPDTVGHMLIARAVLKAIDFDWETEA